MTTELWILLASCGLGLIHLTAASFSFKAQVGNAYTVGARDDAKQPVGIAARLHRAQWNFLETFPIFTALVVTLQLTQTQNDWSYWGAWIYLRAIPISATLCVGSALVSNPKLEWCNARLGVGWRWNMDGGTLAHRCRIFRSYRGSGHLCRNLRNVFRLNCTLYHLPIYDRVFSAGN